MGPPEGFRAFVAEEAGALFRTAYLLTGDPGAADDLLQTALLRAARRWDPAAGRAAATSTGRAAATSAVRRELVAVHTGRRLWIGDLLADSRLLAGTAGLPGFGPQPADPGPRDDLTAALHRLPARTRAALVLQLGDGLPEAAAADALGGTVGDVGALTRDGLDRLRRVLDEPDADDDALAERLRRALAADVVPVPAGTADRLADAARARRRNAAGLIALAVFLVAVVVLVVVLVATG